MPRRLRVTGKWLPCAGLALGPLLVGIGFSGTPAVEPADGFRPVAPAPAIQAVLEANLKIVQDWLKSKDYGSAAETVHGLQALVQVYSYQTNDPAWRTRIDALRTALAKLAALAKAKDADGSRKAVQECEALLAEMSKNPPRGERATDPAFKPVGALRHWMLLLDGTYADAKSAGNARELEDLAYTLAEGANALRSQRGEARWRQAAQDVREAALVTAGKAHKGQLEPARQSLKTVYQRCEACHESYKR